SFPRQRDNVHEDVVHPTTRAVIVHEPDPGQTGSLSLHFHPRRFLTDHVRWCERASTLSTFPFHRGFLHRRESADSDANDVPPETVQRTGMGEPCVSRPLMPASSATGCGSTSP